MKKILLLSLLFLCSSSALLAQAPAFQFGHRGSIIKIKFSPDGSQLLSYSSGNQDLCLWEVESGRLIWKRPISFIRKADEYYTLNSIAWSPGQDLIATGSANGTVQLWNAKTGKFLWRADAHKDEVSALAFSPDGKTIASASSDKSDAVKLIRTDDGKTIAALQGNACPAAAIAFDKNGAKLQIGRRDNKVIEWDLATGKLVNDSNASCRNSEMYSGQMSFSKDLRFAAGRTAESELVIKDVTANKVLHTLKINDTTIKSAFSGDNEKLVASRYGGYLLYDLQSGREHELDDCVSGSAFDLNNDGSLFAQSCSGYKTSIKITGTATGKSWFLDGHPGFVNAMTFSPDGKILAIAGNDQNIYFLDPAGHHLLKTLSGHGDRVTALAFSADGKILFSGDGESVVRKWEVSSGSLLGEVKAYDRSDDIEKLEISRDGKSILLLVNGYLALYNAEKLKQEIVLRTSEGYESKSGGMTIGYSSVPINSAAFSIDGSKVFTGHTDGTLRSWDARTGTQASKFNLGDDVSFVIAAPDGKNIIARVFNKEEKSFQLIDIGSGKVIQRSGKIDITYVERASISPDEKYLAVVGNIGDTTMLNLADLKFIRKLDYEYSGSDTVAFSPDGTTFFIGGENQNLFQYDVKTGAKLWQLLPSFKPDGSELALEAEYKKRIDALQEIKSRRDSQAAIDVETFRKKVYLTFEHYGDMSDPGEKRIMESDEPKESKTPTAAKSATAVWLRLHNDSPLPIDVPTLSMYFPDPKCFHQFSNGEKMLGLCDNREIGVWFGVKDKAGEWVPYGFDFGSSATLLPGKSVLFPVPIGILRKDHFIVFDYAFQNVRASENDLEWDYGEKIELRFGKQNLP